MRSLCFIFITFACVFSQSLHASEQNNPIVIAHRGASGYLPEHTLEAKTLAYALGADYIEQDLVLSKDNHLIVMHDIYLDHVTDVASKFPDKARADGHFYTIDFTLPELKQLRVTGPFVKVLGKEIPKYGKRFPLWRSQFQLATFEEELELIQGLNQSLGYNTGIYPEIKKPYFHAQEGRDISRAVLQVLKQYGYTKPDSKVYLQSFDAEELQRIHQELLPAMNMDIPLVQLIAETDWEEKRVKQAGQWQNYDFDWMHTPEGLKKIAGYAAGIGPWHPMLVNDEGTASALLTEARKLGLQVHPYTFRADPLQIPDAYRDFEEFIGLYVEQLQVDGLFTDHPDKVRSYLSQRREQQPREEVSP
ncbi:glycerophosphodiester phosphodiesterase [Microbulbifer agarilyticus]|uniref:glycerophosphodiester phosphodiesterase n=1 Tax=Microbulbifer agarilyticus TaxID=260552 RepID=A0A1Q2M8P5_9GAMM|nr:glycerophosphodiester phosphodiesterase [Microbulbifer agarilyticus]AQQ68657.1 glycerophosphodiester phosphodiesterase [Microbulbifer agarilyticus]